MPESADCVPLRQTGREKYAPRLAEERRLLPETGKHSISTSV